MAYTPWSVVFGETPSASKWNILGTNDQGFYDGTGVAAGSVISASLASAAVTPVKWTNPYKFSVYAATSPSIANTTQKVIMDTKNFDSNNNFDATTNRRYTAPVTGFYLFICQVWMGSAGAGTTENATALIYKNGSAIRESDRINGNGDANRLMRPKVFAFLSLTAGDYIEAYATFVGSRDVTGGANDTFLEGFLVSQT